MKDEDRATSIYQKTGFIDRISIDELNNYEKFNISQAFKNVPPIIYRCTKQDYTIDYLEPKQFKKQPKGKYQLVMAVKTK